MNQTYSELQRRVENILCIGEISETDHALGRCKVAIGGMVTNWLSVPQNIGRNYTQNNPVRIGSQVLLASVSGELSQAIIIAMLPSEELPPPSSEPHIDIIQFNDGTVLSYNSDSNQLDINAVNKINISCKNALVTATGNVAVDASSIKLNGGTGVVTGSHICAFTGAAHSDCSSTVTAGK